MHQIAEDILAIISDYHNYRAFQFTNEHIIKWVNQFDEGDRIFILQELLHLLKQGIYISESKAKQLLIARIESLSIKYKYTKPVIFLANAQILSLQGVDKSQTVIVRLLDEALQAKYSIGIAQCGTVSNKFTLYFDDVLATGGTLYKDINTWLLQMDNLNKTNLDKVITDETILLICHFCSHNANTTLWRLKEGFKKDKLLKKIHCFCDYEVQNHLNFLNQRFNFAYPIVSNDEAVATYFNSLPHYAHKNGNKAFRVFNEPKKETFFSSPDNRIRFENILLTKGIELLKNADSVKDNHRPLGATIPSYKIMGTGTLFFTWRNISNTTPIVFWWGASNWFPLFPLFKRGN
jgi:hypothetical protein